jgi:hypothetical protein
MKTHAYTADFEAFWQQYPNRVGKLKAHAAYVKARRRASQAELLAGVARYIRTKPAWQHFAHPSSWLNAGRWLDETDVPADRVADYLAWTCPHDPKCGHPTPCRTKAHLEAARAGKDA